MCTFLKTLFISFVWSSKIQHWWLCMWLRCKCILQGNRRNGGFVRISFWFFFFFFHLCSWTQIYQALSQHEVCDHIYLWFRKFENKKQRITLRIYSFYLTHIKIRIVSWNLLSRSAIWCLFFFICIYNLYIDSGSVFEQTWFWCWSCARASPKNVNSSVW